jgi:hypothetical protein
MIITIRTKARSQADLMPCRPDRFAWTDEEAQIIFSQSLPIMASNRLPTTSEGRPRILVAGRYDPRVNDVRSALEAARDSLIDRFVILDRSPQHYMQCLCLDAGWLLEKRDGDAAAHFRAVLNPDEPNGRIGNPALLARIFPDWQEPTYYLPFEQVLEAMHSYHQTMPEPHWLQWQRVDVS